MQIIGERERFGSHLGLERIGLVCAALGNPQQDLKFIHVAGTSGKGSVSASLAAVLQRSGLQVGLFSSPHLVSYAERFQINGELIAAEDLQSVVARAEEACRQVEAEHPEYGRVTEFELATAAAFLYFHQAGVDLVVLETGLGGRLDATNVVTPVLTVITTVHRDHEDRLGSTIESIAREKGGIIKTGVPVVSGVKLPEAEGVLRELAQDRGAPYLSTRDVPWVGGGWDLDGGRINYPGLGEVEIGLLGDHQLENAATALLALMELRKQGYNLPSAAIYEGMKAVTWPGRLEVVSREPLLILDGGHNQEGLTALARSLKQLQECCAVEPFTVVFGMLHNKSLSLLDPLLPVAGRFVFTAAQSGRLAPMQPEVLQKYVLSRGVEAVTCADPAQALDEAGRSFPVCVCGSLYLVGEVKRFLHSQSGIIA
jgi:dihydrofolate synthase/folylpolyglutamate synthase